MNGVFKKEWMKKWDFYKVCCLLLGVTFVAQLLLCCYFNLFTLRSHLGYDSSWALFKSALIWNEKTLSSPYWIEQTGRYYDSAIPLAALLFGITKRLFFSYGLANMIILPGILAAMYFVLKSLNIGMLGTLAALNLTICPYLTNDFAIENDLGYFSCVIGGPAFYAVRFMTALIIIRAILNMDKEKNKRWIVASLVLSFLSGISVGVFMIVVLVVPCIMYLLEKTLIQNNVKILIKKESVFIYAVAGAILLGKLVGEKLFLMDTIDESRTWTAIEDLWSNAGAVIQGFVKLIGALPVTADKSENILTPEGMRYLFPLCILVVAVIAIVYFLFVAVKKAKEKGMDFDLLLPCNIVLGNFLVFSLFNAHYGAVVFEERYLVIAFAATILLIAALIERMDKKHLLYYIIPAMLILGIIGTDLDSDNKYRKTTNEELQMNQIVAYLQGVDGDLVYVWGDTVSVLGRNLRVFDFSKTYKCVTTAGTYHGWGDSAYLGSNEQYDGATILICPKSHDFIPERILAKYELIQEFRKVDVYRSSGNPLDLMSGITSDKSVDFPYSPGMYSADASLNEDGELLIVSKEDGYKLWGPYVESKEGCYNFTIYYTVLEETGADIWFDVAIDTGAKQLGLVLLSADGTAQTLENVVLEDGHELEYRVFVPRGAQVKIDRIEIEKIN